MKASGKCPKCASYDVVTNFDRAKQGHRTYIGITIWSTMQVATYVCTQCGFVEEYLDETAMRNPSKMEKLRAKWKKREMNA